MKRFSRKKTALLLTVIYLMIALSPAASRFLASPAVTHALTGECVGECALCGCDPEKSATRTCCCWQKKRQDALRFAGQTHTAGERIQVGQERSKEAPNHAADGESEHDCCEADHDEAAEAECPTHDRDAPPAKKSVLLCSCPCGSLPPVALAGAGQEDQLPSPQIIVVHNPLQNSQFSTSGGDAVSRPAPPPDPPPRLFSSDV